MTVILRQSNDLANVAAYDAWFAVTDSHSITSLDVGRKLPNLAERLEKEYEESRSLWWDLGREMTEDPSARHAHAPTACIGASDFGLMLAKSKIVEELAAGSDTYLVVCDDPWMFRHLQTLKGVRGGKPPILIGPVLRLWLRGYLSRILVAWRSALACLRLRRQRAVFKGGEATLLVYGHPGSSAKGFDAYFGDLLITFSNVRRLLHVDCPVPQAKSLSEGGQTASLHAWGGLVDALPLVTTRWKPRRELLGGSFGWLIRRAADAENGGGGLAMIRWQTVCQNRWLRSTRPRRVIWPWENLAWERELCRSAKENGCPTAGYQHSVVGPHQINYSTATNRDIPQSIPDIIIANGQAYKKELIDWGTAAETVIIGGSFRIRQASSGQYDPQGPIFAPLTAHRAIARQHLEAARRIAATGREVRVKEHPMYPMVFEETENLRRTDKGIGGGVPYSAVLYTQGSTGIEALLSGIPVYRLLLEDYLCVNVLPKGIKAPITTLENVVDCLAEPAKRPDIDWNSVFAPIDIGVWQSLLAQNSNNSHMGIALDSNELLD